MVTLASQGCSSAPGWHQQIVRMWPRVFPQQIWDRRNTRTLWNKRRRLTLSDCYQAWRDLFTTATYWTATTRWKLSARTLNSKRGGLKEQSRVTVRKHSQSVSSCIFFSFIILIVFKTDFHTEKVLKLACLLREPLDHYTPKKMPLHRKNGPLFAHPNMKSDSDHDICVSPFHS